MGDIDDVDTIDIKRESHDTAETDDGEIDIGMPRKVPLSPNSPENDSVDLDVENRGVQDPIHIPLAGEDGNFQHTQRFTNFFMEEILKPEFGQKKKYKHTNIDSNDEDMKDSDKSDDAQRQLLWPAWVYCTRYSDRPSSGPRSRKIRKKAKQADEKRPRTAFTNDQLNRLRKEFEHSRYLTEQKRQELARDLQLTESQIKIWFQNKRAKLKKASGVRNELAMQLMAQGLYNHATVPVGDEK